MNDIAEPFGSLSQLIRDAIQASSPAWVADLVLAALSVVIVIAVVPGLVISAIWAERRIIAKMQDRIGPNRVGPFGLLQPIADAVKLLAKEDVIPSGVDRPLFIAAPIIVLGGSLMVWATIPWGPGLSPADLNVGVLFVIAMAGLPTLGIIMAGWSSNNKYSLFGGMRAAAQFISYEIVGVLAAVIPVMLAGSMQLGQIVKAQEAVWFVFYPVIGQLAFLIFLIAGIAESNRSPFDLVEAESELGGGFHTEYSGMRFAVFFLAEYANMFAISGMGTILFLGGWTPVLGIPLPPFIWFFLKMYFLAFVFIWIRSTLPRLRYDQLMHFAWKQLLPLSLLNVGVTSVAVAAAKQMLR
ncbi:MAG: NADH-quinone oxidoreductase subunit NuoH [Chloroflexota bacterium]